MVNNLVDFILGLAIYAILGIPVVTVYFTVNSNIHRVLAGCMITTASMMFIYLCWDLGHTLLKSLDERV